MKFKNWLKDFFKGASLGTGILPGVSVGTVGIIVGVYDKLIDSINGLRKNFKKSVLTLLPIGLGCIIVAAILLILQSELYEIIPFELTCLFAGFVLGGIPVVYKDVKDKKFEKIDWFRILGGTLIAAGIGVLSVISKKYWGLDMSFAFENPNDNIWIYPLTAIAGFIAAVGCLLPGISGSMILFIFGLYQPIVGLFKGDNSMLHNTSRIGTGIILTILLLIGIVIGFLAISKAMSSLLEKHKRGTLTCVIGFIAGSFVSMFVNQDIWDIYVTLTLAHIIIGIVVLLVSTFGFYFLIKKFALKSDN